METSLERLTKDVSELASIVRQQGSTVEDQIHKLMLAVSQAASPRKTDWQTLISAAFLIIAIISAVFWPLSQKMGYIETRLTDLNSRTQSETTLIAQELKTQINNISTKYDREVQNLGDRIVARVNEYDKERHEQMLRDLEELRLWRLHGFGLNPSLNQGKP